MSASCLAVAWKTKRSPVVCGTNSAVGENGCRLNCRDSATARKWAWTQQQGEKSKCCFPPRVKWGTGQDTKGNLIVCLRPFLQERALDSGPLLLFWFRRKSCSNRD